MKLLRDVLIILAITFLLTEIAARVATSTTRVGMPRMFSFALLPWRPSPELVIKWQEEGKKSNYMVRDPELGWTIAKNGGTTPEVEANAQGARAKRDRIYADDPGGKIRVVTVGDSFTHGDEVANHETWQSRVEEARPDLEVVNLGLPGGGSDQALLRYRRDAAQFHPKVGVLGILPENVTRNVNLFRYYLTPNDGWLSKPRFIFKEGGSGELELINSPIPTTEEVARAMSEPESYPMMKHEFWYTENATSWKPLRHSRLFQFIGTLNHYRQNKAIRARLYSGEDPTGNNITVAIAQKFRDEVIAAGGVPVVMIMPWHDFIGAPGFVPEKLSLRMALEKGGVEVLDPSQEMMEEIQKNGAASVFLPSGHYTANGNAVFAKIFAKKIDPFLAKIPAGN